ncbi:MAG: UDP-N-acetylmuramyl-tripeptide synthetase [Burkholderiaceae bacterium]
MSPSSARQCGRWLRQQLAPGARLCADSRRVGAGDGFIAFAGDRHDGRAFIGQALAGGAGAVLYDADAAAGLYDADAVAAIPATTMPMKACPDLRRVAGEVASVFYEEPSKAIALIAFTGTNGKTTCADWCAAGLGAGGMRSASLGTLGLRRHPRDGSASMPGDMPGSLTTPDAVALQDTLAGLRDQGVSHVALEASSIGIERHRLNGCQVAVAVFTNLSRDHLDFHGDMASYARAKAALFAMPGLRGAALNGDDPAAAEMLAALPADVPLILFGERPAAPARASVLRLAGLQPTATGSHLMIEGDHGSARVALGVPGMFNARNALAVLASWLHLGVGFERACQWLETLVSVPGRLQPVGGQGAPLVVIDYAHTPDALLAALDALRPNARRAAAGSGVVRLWW